MEKYSVFYKDGDEANDSYLSRDDAMKLAHNLESDGYEVIVCRLDGDYWFALEAAAERLEIPKMPTDKNGDPIEVGTKVRWYDPDESARDLTRVWEVFKIDEDIIHIAEIGSSSEAEVYSEELEVIK